MEPAEAKGNTQVRKVDTPHKAFRPIGYDELIKARLYLEPSTGEVTNENGRVLGSRNKASGRVMIRIGAFQFYRSHIVWLLHTGDWPEHTIDHINRDQGDDRVCNLRDVTQSENNYNRSHCDGC